MEEIKFTAWIGKGYKIENLRTIGRLYYAATSEQASVMELPDGLWPQYQVEIIVKKVEIENGQNNKHRTAQPGAESDN